jgi:hypothetical protein
MGLNITPQSISAHNNAWRLLLSYWMNLRTRRPLKLRFR